MSTFGHCSQPPVLLPALADDTDLRVFDNLRDYATTCGELLPNQRVVHLSMYTPPCHMVSIFDRNHRIPFQNIPKPWFIVHVWVQSCPQRAFEGQFVSFHQRVRLLLCFWRQDECSFVQDQRALHRQSVLRAPQCTPPTTQGGLLACCERHGPQKSTSRAVRIQRLCPKGVPPASLPSLGPPFLSR